MPDIIDVPIESLPHVDEHEVHVEAPESDVWDALVATLPRVFDTRFSRRFAPAVGVAHPLSDGEFGRIGSTLPGFVVSRSVAPCVLALLGEHRFSRYALIFRIDRTSTGASRLRAETRAVFPGLKGRAYRGFVIGTRGHVLVVRRMLGAVQRRAEAKRT